MKPKQWPEGAHYPITEAFRRKHRSRTPIPSHWQILAGEFRSRDRDISDKTKTDYLLDGLGYRYREERCFTRREKTYPWICPHCRLAGVVEAFPERAPFLEHLKLHQKPKE